MKNFKTPFLSALVFFGTLLVLSVWYAAWTIIDANDYKSGAPLSSTLMSAIVGNIENLSTRLTGVEGKLTSGYMVGYAYTNNTTNTTITWTIPFDDTIPQSTEGTEIINVTITPKSATNLLEIEWIVHYAEVINSSDYFTLAGFKDASVSAFATATSITSGNFCSPSSGYTYICQASFRSVIPAWTTNPTIIHLRAGINLGTAEINGSNGRRLGGSLTSSLTIREIAQ